MWAKIYQDQIMPAKGLQKAQKLHNIIMIIIICVS